MATDRDASRRELEAIAAGCEVEGTHCAPVAVAPVREAGQRPRVRVVVAEGRKHEARPALASRVAGFKGFCACALGKAAPVRARCRRRRGPQARGARPALEDPENPESLGTVCGFMKRGLLPPNTVGRPTPSGCSHCARMHAKSLQCHFCLMCGSTFWRRCHTRPARGSPACSQGPQRSASLPSSRLLLLSGPWW